MNTFLPYASFEQSASCLDDRRLCKQRLEARQLLDTLRGRSDAWAEHPCAEMWRGHELWLAAYALACCNQWVERGFRDNMMDELRTSLIVLPNVSKPTWLVDERLHSSHRANLLRKDAIHYGKFGWLEKPSDVYWWPTREAS